MVVHLLRAARRYAAGKRSPVQTGILLLFAFTLPLAPVQAQPPAVAGFKEIDLRPQNGRPLHVALWYPGEHAGPVSLAGDTRRFYGDRVVSHLPVAAGRHPVLLLSHGLGGSWRNLSWLAADLSRQGYVVAAVDHPGTTVFNRDPQLARQLWLRPRDLSLVIDALSQDASLAGQIDTQRIAALGHSLGGWTVMALGGGRFDISQFRQQCQQYPQLMACGLVATLGLDDIRLQHGMMADSRVKALITLDGGVLRGFTPQSLAAISTPTLIVAAGTDIGDMPAALESGYLQAQLPAADVQSIGIADAMHFSFIQRCKPQTVTTILCRDGGNRSRQAIHRQTAEAVSRFLTQALPPP